MAVGGERLQLTLPPRAASWLNADLHQGIFRGSLLPTVIGRDREFVLMLFVIVQLLCVFNITWQSGKTTRRTRLLVLCEIATT